MRNAPGERIQEVRHLVFFLALHSNICHVSSAYLHHSYNKGKGSARRFLIQRSRRPRTGQSRAYSPTSPSEEPCLQPRLRAACPGSSPVKVSGCPCESPSSIGASLFVPCCERHKGKRKGNNEDGEGQRQRERGRGERDKTQIGRSIREIMLSPDCVTRWCVTTEYMIFSTMLLILLIWTTDARRSFQTTEMFGQQAEKFQGISNNVPTVSLSASFNQ